VKRQLWCATSFVGVRNSCTKALLRNQAVVLAAIRARLFPSALAAMKQGLTGGVSCCGVDARVLWLGAAPIGLQRVCEQRAASFSMCLLLAQACLLFDLKSVGGLKWLPLLRWPPLWSVVVVRGVAWCCAAAAQGNMPRKRIVIGA
jgi:hypothetical protein